MKYIRYLLVALMVGAGFGAGLLAVLIYLPPLLFKYDSSQFEQQRIAEVEAEIGMSCMDLHVAAMAFAEKDIAAVIASGRQGNDWRAEITAEQKSFIDSTQDKLFRCVMINRLAKEHIKSWPVNFTEIHDLYSSLSIFSTRYSEKTACTSGLKPEALERLVFLYESLK